MSRKRLVSMVGGTVTCALAIGFFMQRAETSAPRNLVPELPSPIQQVVLKPAVPVAPTALKAADIAPQPKMENLVLTSSMAPAMIQPSLPEPALWAASSGEIPPEDAAIPADPDMPVLGCDVTATAIPGPMAMVDLDVSAPCFSNERVTIHHSGMMFTLVTDEVGELSVKIPALNHRAVFVIAFSSGKGTVALTNVPTLSKFDRVAVQWTGNTGFQIHAREFGATYGEIGHVWSGSDSLQSVGFITRLGDPETLIPQMAEVYTFPSSTTSQSGVIALSVEAEVTPGNCGRDISAQSLELRARSPLRTRDLVLAMPNCSALGDFLVLNNLVDDLKIAAR